MFKIEAKDNLRLNEVRLALNLNRIEKLENNVSFKNCISILSCLALSLGKKENNHLYEIIRKALNTNLLGASDKEIIAVCKTFYKPTVAAKKLGITYPYYTVKYGALLSRDFIKDTWMETLKPLFPEDVDLIKVVNDFIEKFYFPTGNRNNVLSDKLRTYEIDFWIIYSKLYSIYENNLFIDKFIFNICNMFGIDYASVAHLKNNLYKVTRSFPLLKYRKGYFMQEVCNLGYAKGLKKGTISSHIFERDSHYLYNNKSGVTKNVLNDPAFQQFYTPTLDWENIDRISIRRFNDLFQDFIDYDVN